MRVSSRFPIAVHTMLCIAHFEQSEKVTSAFIAGSVNVNPVIIRTVIRQLKDAGLVTVDAGVGGAHIAKPLRDITLLDIYVAVEETTAASSGSTTTRIRNARSAAISTPCSTASSKTPSVRSRPGSHTPHCRTSSTASIRSPRPTPPLRPSGQHAELRYCEHWCNLNLCLRAWRNGRRAVFRWQ